MRKTYYNLQIGRRLHCVALVRDYCILQRILFLLTD